MKTGDAWRSRHPALANVLAAAIAVLLVGVWVPGLLRDDLTFPVSLKVRGGHHFHFHGAAAWLFFAGFVCLSASVVVVIARRLTAEPAGQNDQRVPAVMALAGLSTIVTMMVLRAIGLV